MEKHGKVCIRRGKSCEQFLAEWSQKCGMWENLHQKMENPKKPKDIFVAVGPNMMKNVGNLASEEGRGFGTVGPSKWQKCRKCPGKTWEILHQKRTRPVQNPGFAGAKRQKVWKNVGHIASEKDKSCEKPRFLGEMRSEMWKNVGNFASEEENLEKCGTLCGQSWCNPWKILHQKRKP